ncbi:hypothetical protein Tco_0270057 [Tanacetum coccineum]
MSPGKSSSPVLVFLVVDLDSVRCPLCDEDLESEDHIFVSCEIASGIWKDELVELTNLLAQLNLSDAVDTWEFSIDSTRIFSVKSMRNHITIMSNHIDSHPTRWNKLLPIKRMKTWNSEDHIFVLSECGQVASGKMSHHWWNFSGISITRLEDVISLSDHIGSCRLTIDGYSWLNLDVRECYQEIIDSKPVDAIKYVNKFIAIVNELKRFDIEPYNVFQWADLPITDDTKREIHQVMHDEVYVVIQTLKWKKELASQAIRAMRKHKHGMRDDVDYLEGVIQDTITLLPL